MTFQLRDIPGNVGGSRRPLWMQGPEHHRAPLRHSPGLVAHVATTSLQVTLGTNLNGLQFLICAGEQRSHLGRIACLLFI